MCQPVRLLHVWKSMRFDPWQSESPDEARQRRLCRKMLMLPPETEYHHVLPGFATLGALGLMLLAFVAWRLGRLGLIAPLLATGLALTIFTAGTGSGRCGCGWRVDRTRSRPSGSGRRAPGWSPAAAEQRARAASSGDPLPHPPAPP